MKIFLQAFLSLLILVAAILALSTQADIFPLGDYIEYWAAGQLILSGENPYDSTQLLAAEKSVGWNNPDALIMYNPPWILSLTMLMALLPYPISRASFFVFGLFILGLCAEITWKQYNGARNYRWIAWFLSFTTYGGLHVINGGQISILLILAVCLFLYFITLGKEFQAGFFVPLLLVKPHIIYLFLLAIGLWSFSRNRWRMISGIIAGMSIFTIIPMIANPQIATQYLYFVQNNPIQIWATATLSTPLRILFEGRYFWIQFLPSILGLIWFFWYWFHHTKDWDWIYQTPLLLLMSMVTSSYGWIFDHIVFYLAIIQISTLAVKAWPWKLRHWVAFISYWLLNLFLILISTPQHELWWASTAMLILYLYSINVFTRSPEPFGISPPKNVANLT